MLPRVILHNAISVDGRIVGFEVNIGLYYELAMRWQEDATLAGSDTILAPMEEIPAEDDSVFEQPEDDPNDTRPILVIPDSKGRVRIWHYLKQQPYWRKFIALVSESTPKEYLEYLEKRHINYILTGKKKVDLRTALDELNVKYGVKKVRMDSGGTLNGVLLRAGLVDEISVLIHPSLVGGSTEKSIFRAPDLISSADVVQLKLTHVEKLSNEIVWVRYNVIK
jgi:2,5-diamino-6-(ribosylamino)-4(3H)-pyrimidinone 5'-phosphate reductase